MRARRTPADEGPARGQAQGGREEPTPQGRLLALQSHAGNAAVGRLLQRHEEDDAATAVAGPDAGPAAAPPAGAAAGDVAAAEAIATETVTRIDRAIDAMAATTGNATARNTAGLLRGSPPRVRFTPMTPRSDSEAIRAARGQAAGSVTYFFTGTTQPPLGAAPAAPPPGTLEKRPSVMGTIRGDSTVVIRGQDQRGRWQSEEDFKGVLIHEASHILLKAYGEHPGTVTDAASFDRYKDEFRAYFVEQYGPYAGERDLDKRARMIKRHLIGDSLTDTRGYPLLRNAYWSKPAGDRFRTDIDGHMRPDGFNLTNSPRLDRFFAALEPAAADPLKVDDVMAAVSRLTAEERVEARTSPLIRRTADACGADAATRIFAALDAPTRRDYTGELNPSGSARIARLYEEIARTAPQRMRDAYTALTAGERAGLQFNAATMVYVDHNVLDPRTRACVYAMLTSRSATQYTAMDDFLETCFLAHIGSYGDPPAGLPDEMRAAARRLTFESRLALYRLVEDARTEWVDVLPAPVSGPLLAILRGDADP